MPGPFGVAVLSPHAVVVAGVTSILGRRPDLVTVVAVGEVTSPDLVLYDTLGLHDADGSDLRSLLGAPAVPVLALSRDLRPDLTSRALRLGAVGYVSLGVEEEELVSAVASTIEQCRSAAANGAPSSGAIDDADLQPGHDAGLTRRESEVLSMITRGYSNQEIADCSYLSINSVKTYIRSAYRRIGVTSRSQAVVWALQHGFVAERDETISD